MLIYSSSICSEVSMHLYHIHTDESKKELSQFSKNYLPILFELYIGTAGVSQSTTPADRGPLISCIQAYVSITGTRVCV